MPSTGKLAIDLACGTGELAEALCSEGFSVLGVDLSAPMLTYAKQRCSNYVSAGSAEFVEGDMVYLEVEGGTASLVTCSYDSINHLADEEALMQCFTRVAGALERNGLFIFDLNTVRGLEDWNRILITERPGYTVFSRGFFDKSMGRAWKKFSGFRRLESGYYEGFEQIIFNTAFPVDRVTQLLTAAGLDEQYVALLQNIHLPVSDAESHDRVIIVARQAHMMEPSIVS